MRLGLLSQQRNGRRDEKEQSNMSNGYYTVLTGHGSEISTGIQRHVKLRQEPLAVILESGSRGR